MKKLNLLTLSILSVLGTSLFLFSCTSTKAPVNAQDSYQDDNQTSLNDIDESSYKDAKTLTEQENASTALPSKTPKPAKEKEEKRPIFSFGNKYDFEVLKETTCNSKNMFGALGESEAKIMLYLKDGTVGIGSKVQGIYFISLYDENARTKFIKAYQNYLSDFEQKKLIRNKANKTYKAYGNAKVTLRWGSLQSSTPNNGSGTMTFGYTFEKNSPYFVITMQPVYNKHYDDVQEATTRQSQYYRVYFTKAQAQAMVDCFEPEYLNTVFSQFMTKEEAFKPVITGDEY